jgi:hypothetical protein
MCAEKTRPGLSAVARMPGHQQSDCARRRREGPDESSPVRSAGDGAKDKSVPSGTIETVGSLPRMRLREHKQTSIVPFGTGRFFEHQPSTSYWASFILPSGTSFL